MKNKVSILKIEFRVSTVYDVFNGGLSDHLEQVKTHYDLNNMRSIAIIEGVAAMPYLFGKYAIKKNWHSLGDAEEQYDKWFEEKSPQTIATDSFKEILHILVADIWQGKDIMFHGEVLKPELWVTKQIQDCNPSIIPLYNARIDLFNYRGDFYISLEEHGCFRVAFKLPKGYDAEIIEVLNR